MELYNSLPFDILEKIGKEKVLIDKENKQKQLKNELNKAIKGFTSFSIEYEEFNEFLEACIEKNIFNNKRGLSNSSSLALIISNCF
tara:strand:- start:830 stop:1087 length:258 start_codon:yes stop_codon:yes gene_type:complete